jgi:hypothetical protein
VAVPPPPHSTSRNARPRQLTCACCFRKVAEGVEFVPATSPPPPPCAGPPLLQYLGRCTTMSIDVCRLLSQGCKEVEGVRTHGYHWYRHGFCTTPWRNRYSVYPYPPLGMVFAGTGMGTDFPTRGLPVLNPSCQSNHQSCCWVHVHRQVAVNVVTYHLVHAWFWECERV